MFAAEMKCLQSMPMFRDVSMAKLKLLALAGERLVFEASQDIVKQGAVADAVYIVLDGQVELLKVAEDAVVPLARLGEGYIVGDAAVILGAPYPITVVAVTQATLLKVGDKVFMELIREVPQLSMAMMQDLARRLLVMSQSYADAVG